MSLEKRSYSSERHPRPSKWKVILIEGLAPTYWADLSREARGSELRTRKPIKVISTVEEIAAAGFALSGYPAIGGIFYAKSKATELLDISHQKAHQLLNRLDRRSK